MLEFGIVDSSNYKNSLYVFFVLTLHFGYRSIRCNVSAEWHSLKIGDGLENCVLLHSFIHLPFVNKINFVIVKSGSLLRTLT